LSEVFGAHATPAYVQLVREVRFLNQDTALLRAASGLVPPGQEDLKPELNAIQSLLAVRNASSNDLSELIFDSWQVAHFQNTPAAWHQKPEDAERLTRELRGALKQKRSIIQE
jgi:hypothetical protein